MNTADADDNNRGTTVQEGPRKVSMMRKVSSAVHSMIIKNKSSIVSRKKSSSSRKESVFTYGLEEVHVVNNNGGQQLPRMLCLHGYRSNDDITVMQLNNLGLTGEHFDLTFVRGPEKGTVPADETVSLFTTGPYYSWAPANTNEEDIKDFDPKQILKSLKYLLYHLKRYGPYDVVYGFSQSAALITLLCHDKMRNKIFEERSYLPFDFKPFKFVILGCPANPKIIKTMENYYNIQIDCDSIDTPSVHCIGMADPIKNDSESIMTRYNPKNRLVHYLSGGHEISTVVSKTIWVNAEILDMYKKYGDVPLSTAAQGSRKVSSVVKSLSSSMVELQKEINDIEDDAKNDNEMLEEEDVADSNRLFTGQVYINMIHSSENSLFDILSSNDPANVALYDHEGNSLTYGGLIEFMNGPANLRRAGVKEGEVVAYLAPHGILSATAFLAFTAQCTVIPLDPSYKENDFVFAFEQLHPDYVIVFEGTDVAAIKEASAQCGIKTVVAIGKPGTCGLFEFESAMDTDKAPFYNSASSPALILRTSGTTSVPKIVKLSMWSITSNAYVIAKNLNLTSNDTALNAMPLFHIGGISSNLLSSVVVGASVVILPSFDVVMFVDMLVSNMMPRPTWYSAVPTIHSAVCLHAKDIRKSGKLSHSLRFIRSGAAALSVDLAKEMKEIFGVPIIPTYSMSEQMPISQPPTGFDTISSKPGSVGVPVCASLCVVDSYLRPLENGRGTAVENVPKGEVCISGSMVLQNYTNNPDANKSSYFWIGGKKWFRTGDMGYLDKDGFLFLTGRNKEMIKRGGEQISPHEVEDALKRHHMVKNAVAFGIPDKFWGQRLGTCIVFEDNIDPSTIKNELKKDLRSYMIHDQQMPQFKVPEEILFVTDDILPKTTTRKYVRVGLADVLREKDLLKFGDDENAIRDVKNVSIHPAVNGMRFVLALAVNYVHYGKLVNWSDDGYRKSITNPELPEVFGWAHSRSWCVHTPLFFFIGGFLLAGGTHADVTRSKSDLLSFYIQRLFALHPMYLLSIVFCTINWIARCTPSNYISEFDPERPPLDGEYFVCQATAVEMPWGLTLFTSVLNYALGLQSWPFMIPFSWWLSSYTWFSSVYIFCILVFPFCHRVFFRVKDNIQGVIKLCTKWFVVHYTYIMLALLLYNRKVRDDTHLKNFYALCLYLFPPGWLPCFAMGIGAFFLYRYYRPFESRYAALMGGVSDFISVGFLAIWLSYAIIPEDTTPSWIMSLLELRHWDYFMSRVLHPSGIIWFWGISTGKGYTADLFSFPLVANHLSAASYNMFLFHQPVSEWYYLATRGKWWAYPKPFYWFSPYPVPCNPWEFPIVLFIVIVFSVTMETYVNGFLISKCCKFMKKFCGVGRMSVAAKHDTPTVCTTIIAELTFAYVAKDTLLAETGLSSMTVLLLINELKNVYTNLNIGINDILELETVADLAEFIDLRLKQAKKHPDYELGRAAVATKRKLVVRRGLNRQNAFKGVGITTQ